MGAPIRSSTEITQIINRSQHALADIGTQLVDEEKRGITSTDTGHRDKMYRLILLRSFLHNILDDNADVRAYYTASVNEAKFNKILDGLVELSQSFSGPGINIIGVRRNLIFFTGSGSGGGGGGPANPGGTTFQNLAVDSPSENIDSFDANTSIFAFYIYGIMGTNPGEGSRTGTIMANWNGSNTPTYAESRGEDVGGITSPLTFKVELNAGQIELNAYAATDGWIVKGVRILFSNISFINPTGGMPPGGLINQFLRKASGADNDATWQTLLWTMITDVTVSLAQVNKLIASDSTTNQKVYKEIPIGDWNMYTGATQVLVPHGVTNWASIRVLEVMIIADGGVFQQFPLDTFQSKPQGGVELVDPVQIWLNINSIAPAFFYGNTNFQATSFNRGHISILYEP